MINKICMVRKAYFLLLFIFLSPSVALAIDTPRDPRGTEIGQLVIKWEWAAVAGAAHYEVSINGNYRGITRDPQYFSRDLWAGEHSMAVRAIGTDGNASAATQTAKIVIGQQFDPNAVARSFLVGSAPASNDNQQPTASQQPAVTPVAAGASNGFQAPANPRGTEGSGASVTWQWDSVPGATVYEVTVDGAYAGEVSDLQFTSNGLWTGEHSMTVKAVDSSGNRTEQSDTVKINVTGSPSSNEAPVVTTAPAPPPAQGDQNAANVQSLIDPASYSYPEVGQKEGYELVFSDEFNGTALNPFRWHSQLRWDGEFNGERYEYRVINGEDQFYVNVLSPDQQHLNDIAPVYNPFQFDGSRLAIRATRNPLKTNSSKRTFGSLSEISAQQTFLSGALSTHEKFSQKYGYFEARIKIPSHVGTFPAFWLFHERRAFEGTQRTEIDIMENLGHAPWYIYNSFHYFKNVSATYGGDANFIKPYPSGQVFTGTDYSQDYHVYAVDWAPGRVTWFIDGVQTSELINNEVNYEDLYLMLNLAMGGNWTNFPTNAGGLGRPSDQRYPTENDLINFNNPALEIDYVRVYRRR